MAWVTTEAVYRWNPETKTCELVYMEGYEYEGPVALCGGGPSQQEKNAQQAQANLSNQLGSAFNRQQDFAEKQQAQANPFFLDRMNNGLPYYNNLTDAQSGLNAQAFAPAHQALSQRLGSFGNLPSGFAEQARTDLDAQQARAFDANLMGVQQEQEQTKRFGAGGITNQQQIANPLGYASGAMQGNSSILQTGPGMRSPGISGLLGGAASGGLAALGF